MSMKKSKISLRSRCRLGVLATLSLTLSLTQGLASPFSPKNTPPPDPEIYTLKSSKGLRLKILQSNHISFIHAQLVIYYRKKIENPAIPYLTLLNIFERRLRGDDTALLNILKKLGDDFTVEHRPDFLLFKINFLSSNDNILTFIKFLKALYSYKPFEDLNSPTTSYAANKEKQNTEERFKDSIANYWHYFFARKEWKNLAAYQIAYHHFFPSAIMGQTLITPRGLKSVTLDTLRSFYLDTYQFSNSLLVIKGNIENPGLILGHIERTFSSFKRQLPQNPPEEKLTINEQKKIIVFNTGNDESPTMYWFEAVSTQEGGNPIPALVLNNILFTYPTGRLYINARYSGINISRMETQMINHQGMTVICNPIRLRYGDLEKFIFLVDREIKKIRIKRVEKKEFLNALSNILGRLRVNTQDFENDVNLEIIKAEYHTQKVTLESLNQVIDDSLYSLIVIVGNAKSILPQLNLFRSHVEVLDFTAEF
jgi:hypothetical protein